MNAKKGERKVSSMGPRPKSSTPANGQYDAKGGPPGLSKEANTALKVLLSKIERYKEELEKNVCENIDKIILPIMRDLKATRLNHRQKLLVSNLESSLGELTFPMARSFTSPVFRLTPKEVQVAGMIRNGLRSKEIAQCLNVSLTVINFHRRNIRKKLRILNKKVNLRTYILKLHN